MNRVIIIIAFLSLFISACDFDWSMFADGVSDTSQNGGSDENRTVSNQTTTIHEVRFASWYIDGFDSSITNSLELRSAVERVISDYHIVGIQGITARRSFIEFSDTLPEHYEIIIGDFSGDKQKEMMAFVYDSRIFSVEETEYSDSKDKFTFDPFIVSFRTHNSLFNISFIQHRTDKIEATQEIRDLQTVIDSVALDDYYAIMGNLHADCFYYNSDKLSSLNWIIKDSYDTIATDIEDCAYDRIIVNDAFDDEIMSADVSVLEHEYDLDAGLVDALGGHYPVFAVMKTGDIRIQ